MTWVIAVGSAWTVVAVPLALLLGRGIGRADEHAEAPFRIDGVERYLRE